MDKKPKITKTEQANMVLNRRVGGNDEDEHQGKITDQPIVSYYLSALVDVDDENEKNENEEDWPP